jgi:hypothetical protein
VLPLRKDLHRVLVTGPLADSTTAWRSRYGPQRLQFVTVLAGLRKKLGPACEVRVVPGCAVVDDHYPESDVYKEPPPEAVRAGIAAAAEAAKGVEVAVVVLGETDEQCRESRSRVSLNLPGYQEELLQAVQATGVPVVLVLSNGRPLSINWAAHTFDVRTFGATGDGKTLDTGAINQAIDAAAAAGGGTVLSRRAPMRATRFTSRATSRFISIMAPRSSPPIRRRGHARRLRRTRAQRRRPVPGFRPLPLAQQPDLGRESGERLHPRTGPDFRQGV